MWQTFEISLVCGASIFWGALLISISMSSLVVWYPGWVWARGRSVWWLLNFRVDYTLALWCINILVRIHVVWWPGWLGSRVGGTWICTRWQWWQPHKPHATVAPPSNTNTNTNTKTNANTNTCTKHEQWHCLHQQQQRKLVIQDDMF